MYISAFTIITKPDLRQDCYLESIESALIMFDEVVVVDGGSDSTVINKIQLLAKNYPQKVLKIAYLYWPFENWHWAELPKHLNYALSKCNNQSDWFVKFDIDYFFHEKDRNRLYEQLKEAKSRRKVLATFDKYQLIKPLCYYHKGQVPLCINSDYADICFGACANKVTDWCYPIAKYRNKHIKEMSYLLPFGTDIDSDDIYNTGIPVYNFDYTFKTIDVIESIQWEFAIAWNKAFGDWKLGDSKQAALKSFMDRTMHKIKVSDRYIHSTLDLPSTIRSQVLNISEGQLGHDI